MNVIKINADTGEVIAESNNNVTLEQLACDIDNIKVRLERLEQNNFGVFKQPDFNAFQQQLMAAFIQKMF